MAPRSQELIPIPENSLDDPNWLRSLLPSSVRIQSLASKSKARKSAPHSQSLFKDGIFGNRFLSLILQKDGTASFGFHPDNSLPIAKKPDEAFALLQPFLRWEGQPVADNWTTWSAKALQARRAFILPIDKTLALDFLHKAAKEELGAEDSSRANLLDALSYTVQKKKVRDNITKATDLSKTILLPKEEALNESAFVIQLDCKKPFGVAGKLIHPALAHWKAICNDEVLAPRWGTPLSETEWDALYARHFPRQVADNAHRKVRKVYSLPIPAKSGGVRIRRTAADGSVVWQTVDIDGDAFEGFENLDGRPDFTTPKLPARLTQSPRLHMKGYRHRLAPDSGICRMDDWVQIDWNDTKANLLSVDIAPGTKTRLYARIEMAGHVFETAFGQPDCLAMPTSWKCENWPLLIKKPRPTAKLCFEQLGAIVRFSYEMEGAPAELRSAYANAYAAKHAMT